MLFSRFLLGSNSHKSLKARNEKGEEWRDIIRESARKEFEAARHERDPEMVARLLLTGRDYLNQAMEKFMEKRQKIIDEENAGDPSGPPR